MKSINNNTKKDTEDINNSPQAKAYMQSFMEKHWKNWFDIPLPALKNKTPREAAKSESDRECLDALFSQMEQMNKIQKNELLKIDLNYLKKELNL